MAEQINSLAQEIRRVDGTHSLGAGALAEALMPWLAAHDRQVAEGIALAIEADHDRDGCGERDYCHGWQTANRNAAAIARADSLAPRQDAPGVSVSAVIDAEHLSHQREWSRATFGPGSRTKGVLDHIRKELGEIEDDPTDLREWVDVLILAFDGAWRAGWEPQQIIDAIKTKQARNEARTWPDWRTADPEKAIEHVSEGITVGTKRPCSRAGFEEMWDGERWVPICLGCGDEAAYCDGTRHLGVTVTDGGA